MNFSVNNFVLKCPQMPVKIIKLKKNREGDAPRTPFGQSFCEYAAHLHYTMRSKTTQKGPNMSGAPPPSQ